MSCGGSRQFSKLPFVYRSYGNFGAPDQGASVASSRGPRDKRKHPVKPATSATICSAPRFSSQPPTPCAPQNT